MIPPITKIIKRDSGFKTGDRSLIVAMMPGGVISIKPIGAPKSEEVAFNVAEAYEARKSAAAVATPVGDRLEDRAVIKRLQELAMTVHVDGPDGEDLGSKGRYLAVSGLQAILRRLQDELDGYPGLPAT